MGGEPFKHIIDARSFAALHVDNKATCDQYVDASTKIIKYLKSPQYEWMSLQISLWIRCKNGIVFLFVSLA